LASNEPVEKVTFLKTASSAGSKIESYFLPLKVLTTHGATPKPLTKMETISILYYDCLTLSTLQGETRHKEVWLEMSVFKIGVNEKGNQANHQR
jgi:hypothetical protein